VHRVDLCRLAFLAYRVEDLPWATGVLPIICQHPREPPVLVRYFLYDDVRMFGAFSEDSHECGG
jgi:hypothetical protein